MAPKCELALTSLVVVALVAGAAVVSIAALARQPQYAGAGACMLGTFGSAATAETAMALSSYNKAEARILDHDLHPSRLKVADRRPQSMPIKQMLGRDGRAVRDSTGRTFGSDILATAKDGQATEAGATIGGPAAAAEPRPKEAFVAKIGDPTCDVGYYK
jgi:hypothetical protein